ncbi:glycine-rich domain-containing protein [Variovorax boronicumulans]|uniref:glycine-rich domain-containing protein n=1 Tax=Variovorax boronicumulans TaxID=436515 RepID=UPI001C59F70E
MTALSSLNFRKRIAALQWARWLIWYVAIVAGAATQSVGVLVAGLVVCFLLNAAFKAWQASARRQFVREARLPPFLVGKLRAAYPQLQQRDAELVLRGLRQFFMAHLRSDRKFVGMPSKVVDAAWHEFILHTEAYAQWCRSAFGGMLHHTPAEVLGRSAQRNDGLRRSWYWACKEESIDPRQPSRLPLLFALDAKFAVAGGFSYVPDCGAIDRASSSGAHCGSDFGHSGSGSGDAGGFGGSESSSSGSGSDGGGSSDGGGASDSGSSDSGSGCGGGGCGGGGGGD